MPVRSAIREAQRTLATLDAAYARAVAKHERASAARERAIAEQDRLVELAAREVEGAVAAMVSAIGVEMTANVLGIDVGEARRAVRTKRRAVDGDRAAGSARTGARDGTRDATSGAPETLTRLNHPDRAAER